ncbi:hypothetical protein B4113_4094 [Geobacillus sp. B4113_201601]|nr:hypothetical protein B4113_4094 [Geobacillus sp. B4113_201601]
MVLAASFYGPTTKCKTFRSASEFVWSSTLFLGAFSKKCRTDADVHP